MRPLSYWIPLCLLVGCQSVAPKPPCQSGICSVVLQGQVQRSDGSAATGAVTWWWMYDDTLCATPLANGLTFSVDSSARYSQQLFGKLGVRRCFAVYAAASLAARSVDSSRVTIVYTYRTYEPPDTVSLPPIRLP